MKKFKQWFLIGAMLPGMVVSAVGCLVVTGIVAGWIQMADALSELFD